MTDERENLPSASGSERFVACAISHRMELSVPKKESADPLAVEGTLIHEAMEREDGSELNMDQQQIVAKLEELKEVAYRRWREEFPIEDRGIELKEERLWITGDDGEKTGSAKPDWGRIIGTHALLLDWKSGWKRVGNASKSWQGRLQALALKSEHPEVEHIRVGFAQARLTSFYTECDYTAKDLEYARQEWLLAVWRSKQEDAVYNPGPWCSGCRAKDFCRGSGAYSMLPATTVPMMLKTDKLAISNAIASLAHSDLVSIHERAPIIKNVLDAVSTRLKALPVEELKALGLELKPGSKYTSKVEVNPLFQLLWDEGFWAHLPVDNMVSSAMEDFATVTTALTGKLSELVIPRWLERGLFKTKKAAEEHLKDLLAQVSTQETKEPTLRKLKD